MDDHALRAVLDRLRADANAVAGQWRRACEAASLEPGSTGTADLGVVLTLVTTAGGGERDGAGEPADLEWAAEALAPEVRLDVVIRRLACLRDVLHQRLAAMCSAEVAAQAQRRLNAAVDELAERYAARTSQRLEDAAFVDPLTRLLNRRALERDLVRELAQAQRHGRQVSVIVSDLDGLKSINDGEGHAAGDRALCGLADALRHALRDGDAAYRLGGDEFVVLLPDTAVEDVPTVVDRVLACDPPHFSWGTASSNDHPAPDALLDAADRHLFERRRADADRQSRPRAEVTPDADADAERPRPGRPPGAVEGTWRDRPVLGAAVGVVAFLAPVLASLGAAWAVASVLPEPRTAVGRVLWWGGLLAASAVTLFAFDALARRLLPLAALLKLSMVFPDRAPSRLGMALRSGSTRTLRDRSIQALREGDQEPAEAADTILTLAASLGAHDRATRGHSERVRAYADLIAGELGLSADDRDRLRWAALLHDLGKLSVPPMTLNSEEPLSDQDWERLRQHPIEGARLAAPLRAWLGPWATAIEQHHEHFDGTGYPLGLAGEELSLAARIVAVADSYDAMTSVRSYSKGVTPAQARAELARKAGTQFDPLVVRAFLNVSLGRLRLAMGPLALLGALSFSPGLGLVGRSVAAVGRTTALGTVSLVATVAVAQSVAPLVPGDQGRSAETRVLVPARDLAAAPPPAGWAAPGEPAAPGGAAAAGEAAGETGAGPAATPAEAAPAGNAGRRAATGGEGGRGPASTPAPAAGGSGGPGPSAPAGGGPAPGGREGATAAPGTAAPGSSTTRVETRDVPASSSGRTTTTTTTSPPAPTTTATTTATTAAPTTAPPKNSSGEECTTVTDSTCRRYFFDGFFSPVSNTEVNVVKAGSAIPFKWRLTDRHGKPVKRLDTVSGAAFEGSTPGDGSSYELRFDADAQQFVLNVKTAKAWEGSSRRFSLQLDDGSIHTADFRFR